MSQERITNLLANYIIQLLRNHVYVLMFHTFIEKTDKNWEKYMIQCNLNLSEYN